MLSGFQALQEAAEERSRQAFRPGTQSNHKTMVKTYLRFCQDFKRNPLNPSLQTVLAYLEYLVQKLESPKSVLNYWEVVKLIHAKLKYPFKNQHDIQVTLLIRAVSLPKRHISKQKFPITKHHLLHMLRIQASQ